MIQKLESLHRLQPIPEDGMLFVRTDSIFQTMVKAPIIAVGLIIMVFIMPVQNSFSSARSLEIIIYPDGSTHISSSFDVDPSLTDFTIDLFGPTVDNLVIEDENGFLLSSTTNEATATIENFGSSMILVNYDIHDLASKEGRIWTFNLDAPTDYSLLMPENSIIVGMSNFPINMEVMGEQTQLLLPKGPIEINYFFSVPSSTPIDNTNTQPDVDNSLFIIVAAIVAAIIGSVIAIRKKQSSSKSMIATTVQTPQIPEKPIDAETIFTLKPELRDDDKELVKFIIQNGGQALESELRKKFLQPRTTMWRAVKRLERQGIIEIKKKDIQNLIQIKKQMEDFE